MMPIRILLLLHELSRSGAPKIILDVFEALQATGRYDIRIASLNGGDLAERAHDIGPLQILTDYPLPLRQMPAGAAFRLNGRLRNLGPRSGWQPDLLYFNTLVALNWTRYSHLPRAPRLLHVQEAGSAIDRYTTRFAADFRDTPRRYVALTDAVRRDLIARGIDEQKIVVAHPFLHDEAFVQAFAARQNRAASERFTVGGAGRISWCKGPELWLLAARQMANVLGENAVRWVWIGVGDTTDDAQFRATIARLKLEAVVQCVPPTPEPLTHFAGFDAFAMTSWEESASLVTLENMRLEVPVVCFASSGGPPELVAQPQLIISDFSPEAMGKVLCDLAANPQRRADVGRAARQRVQSHFTAATQMPIIERAIAETIERV